MAQQSMLELMNPNMPLIGMRQGEKRCECSVAKYVIEFY